MSPPLSGYTSLPGDGSCETSPLPAQGGRMGLLHTLTHVPFDPLVHEALHVHIPDGILGAVEGQ